MNHFSQNNEQGENYCKFNIIAHFKFSTWFAGRLKRQSKHLIKHTERKSYKEQLKLYSYTTANCLSQMLKWYYPSLEIINKNYTASDDFYSPS